MFLHVPQTLAILGCIRLETYMKSLDTFFYAPGANFVRLGIVDAHTQSLLIQEQVLHSSRLRGFKSAKHVKINTRYPHFIPVCTEALAGIYR